MKLRVLIVDDDASIRESMEMALEGRYSVALACHGVAALEVLARQPIDLVLVDLMMPVLDGPGFVAEAKRRGLRVPIIIMSAGVDLRRRSQQLGVVDYMNKPISLDVLEQKIDQVVAASIAVP